MSVSRSVFANNSDNGMHPGIAAAVASASIVLDGVDIIQPVGDAIYVDPMATVTTRGNNSIDGSINGVLNPVGLQ